MFKIIEVCNILLNLSNEIKVLWKDTKVVLSDDKTEFLEIVASIFHLYTLRLYLFCIVLNFAMRKATYSDEERLRFVAE